MKRSAKCFAFFGVDGLDIVKWYDFTDRIFGELGVEMQSFSVYEDGNDFSLDGRQDVEKIIKSKKHRISGIDIQARRDFEVINNLDWFSCSVFQSENPSFAFFGLNSEGHNQEIFSSHVYQILFDDLDFSFDYGFSFERLFLQGPLSYAVGMVEGLGYSASEIEEADLISKWFYDINEECSYASGMFRDVYIENFLSSIQMKNTVDSLSFEEWVQTSGFGSISKLSESMYLWEVPKSIIPEARAALSLSNLLI